MSEIRITFHQQLEDIERDTVRLAAKVTEAIPRGTEALLDNDLQAAQRLIDDDDDLDELTICIEEQCYQVLALQHPVASDLRSIVAAIRLAYEIERSGDLVVNICKGARRIYPTELDPSLRGLIEQMAEQSAKLFRLAMDAYVERNSALAAALDDMDDRLDTTHKQYIEAILTRHDDIELQAAVQLALIGRYYERIGDHAVNIGEQVRYMVDGWLPEHAGAARAAAKRSSHDEGAASAVDAPEADPAPDGR